MLLLKQIRERITDGALKAVQSEEFQRAVGWAAERTAKIKANLSEAKRQFQEQMAIGSEDDLAPLKRKLDRLEANTKKSSDKEVPS